MMRVKVLRDFAGRLGVIRRKGEVVEIDDEGGYDLIHAGLVEPPLRLRATGDHLIGTCHYSHGELVDVPADRTWLSGEDGRLEPLAAVVPGGRTESQHGTTHSVYAAGEPIAVPPVVALQIVQAGGRYATREEAAALDLGGRDRFAKPAPGEPEGPTTRLFFLNARRLADGRLVQSGEYASVSTAEADDLVEKRLADRCVKVRVVHYNVLAGNRVCSKGDVVEVAKSIAGDESRFERIDLGEKVVEKTVDVLAGIAGKAAVVAEKAGRAVGRRPPADAP